MRRIKPMADSVQGPDGALVRSVRLDFPDFFGIVLQQDAERGRTRDEDGLQSLAMPVPFGAGSDVDRNARICDDEIMSRRMDMQERS
jgi:hypothetical protein